MERRVLDIAEGRRHLAKRRGALAVTRDPGTPNATETLVPFDEIEAVIVHTPEATYSNAALVELAQHGIPLVSCDPSHTPIAWLWPVDANYEQTRRMAEQAAMPEALRAQLWETLVRAKIEAQAEVLREAGLREDALTELAADVRPGDRGNAEARAARTYWWLLFEDFQRSRGGAPPNSLLNYGYAVLRASTARQVCAAGLHPSLGLHHKNRFNAFCLADDLMEPFRPTIDRAVLTLWRENRREVTDEAKVALVAVLAEEMLTDRGIAPLGRCIEWAAQSLARSIVEGENLLRLPWVGANAGIA